MMRAEAALLEEIRTALGQRKTRILNVAQAALHPTQFAAFRKVFLDELGNSGLMADLERIVADDSHASERQDTGRHSLRNKGGVP